MARFVKVYCIVILLISGMAELAAAGLMAFKPDAFLHNLTFQLTQLAQAFAVGAFVMSLLSFALIRFRQRETLLVGLSMLAIYHAGIGITQGIMHYSPEVLTRILFHGFLVASLVFLVIQTVRTTDLKD